MKKRNLIYTGLLMLSLVTTPQTVDKVTVDSLFKI